MTETSISQRLRILLDAERHALVEGDFDQIAALMEEKQALLAELEGAPVAPGEIEPLRDGLRRNQDLFDQALAGLRNVAARLGDLDRVRKSTDTYDAQGRRQTIDAPDVRRLERRA